MRAAPAAMSHQHTVVVSVTVEACTGPHLDGHFVLGEGSAPEQLVDAVDGKEACDVGTETGGHRHPHRMSGDHLSNTTETPGSLLQM